MTLTINAVNVMNDLVELDNLVPLVRSRVLANGCNIEHEACVLLIRKYCDDLNDVGLSDFKSESYKTGGRSGTEYLLDEQQATFLITLMRNSKTVVEFKKVLTKEFFRLRSAIRLMSDQLNNPERTKIRDDGKAPYRQKTDVIEEFVNYATSQGSKSAKKYYMGFAKMENRSLFEYSQKFKNLRDVLNISQLFTVATADRIIEKSISEGMEANMHYKDIFKMAKADVIKLAELIGVSPILQLTQTRG